MSNVFQTKPKDFILNTSIYLLNYKMSWSAFSIRTHVRELLKDLKAELQKNSYSDVIEYLVEFYRTEVEKND